MPYEVADGLAWPYVWDRFVELTVTITLLLVNEVPCT